MKDQAIKSRIEDRVGILTFNLPKTLNAFDGALIDAVNGEMRRLFDKAGHRPPACSTDPTRPTMSSD